MKKRGFTLIELLAVIVILAIIAIIATPAILGVVEKARKGSAESSALGYIDAVEKYIVMHEVDKVKYPTNLQNGVAYQVGSVTGVKVKGKAPDYGVIAIGEKNTVSGAMLRIGNYNVCCAGSVCVASDDCNFQVHNSDNTCKENCDDNGDGTCDRNCSNSGTNNTGNSNTGNESGSNNGSGSGSSYGSGSGSSYGSGSGSSYGFGSGSSYGSGSSTSGSNTGNGGSQNSGSSSSSYDPSVCAGITNCVVFDAGVIETATKVQIKGVPNISGNSPTNPNNVFHITYDANGGTGAPAAETHTFGDGSKISSTIPTRDGYDFLGWSPCPNIQDYPYLESVNSLPQYEGGDGQFLCFDETSNSSSNNYYLYAVWNQGSCYKTSSANPRLKGYYEKGILTQCYHDNELTTIQYCTAANGGIVEDGGSLHEKIQCQNLNN